ncbi:peptidase M23 [Heyndrickxia shackletonii]|uniref:Peptidase M23 n=1 Tax=Heyndrickxia shackletonii TaxID=157838 RepID=A0A0Q3THF6_9BACI|nr:M23 family metallopeptidase [Heyndrickxia shackletonii]KQL53406.1 peptidase M23 [Heyndrickxia shackletonii]NEY99976.1 M23 family metallopeptidase [Heyndrickxia shackletonii]
MGNRADDIRKQIERRKKEKPKSVKKQTGPLSLNQNEWDDHGEMMIYETDPPTQKIHPLWNKETFLFKILASALLVLAVAIMFKSHAPIFQDARNIVKQVMEKEFQFATVSNWYEKKFGKPLAFLPIQNNEKHKNVSKQAYDLAVSGRVLTNFSSDGRGVMIETKNNEAVKAMDSGTIVFAGKKDGLGNTVIVQHADKTYTWYGNLKTINVRSYEQVDTGTKLGTVSSIQDGSKGEFYFAIKKGDTFIDPIQVIKFE